MSESKLSKRYKELREAKNLTIKELAQRINCNEKTISFYENGDRELSIGTLKKYAEFFNVSTDYLLGITDITSSNINRKKICEMTGLTGEALDYLLFAKEEGEKGMLIYRYAIESLSILLTNVVGYEMLDSVYEYIHSREILNGEIEGREGSHGVIAAYASMVDKALYAVTKKEGRMSESYFRNVELRIIGDILEEIREKYEREHINRDNLEEKIAAMEKSIKEDQTRLKELKKLSQSIDKKDDNSDN